MTAGLTVDALDKRRSLVKQLDDRARWTDSAAVSKNSDGSVWGAAVSYPFYSLEAPRAGISPMTSMSCGASRTNI